MNLSPSSIEYLVNFAAFYWHVWIRTVAFLFTAHRTVVSWSSGFVSHFLWQLLLVLKLLIQPGG